METTSKPDYRWWARMEVWSLKQAALLLHGWIHTTIAH